jgi:Tfp pilus assembly protein PilF
MNGKTPISIGLLVLALCSGCAGVPERASPNVRTEALLDGATLFGETILPAPKIDLLRVSPEMKAFVDDGIAGSHFGYSRFRRLMAKLVNEGYFVDQYDRAATYAAAKTFAEKKGNCLAYTNLFVALAREAGLDASYQLVNSHPTWNVESGFLVRNNHINVFIQRIQFPGYADGEVTVDFNDVRINTQDRTRLITDTYAESLFYGNLAVGYLREGDYGSSFAYLKRGILTEPRNVDLWDNLGALYSTMGDYPGAQQVYGVALSLDKRDKTAISGMAKSLTEQGKLVEAEAYTRLALKYQGKNPYYHYAVAEQAFNNSDFEQALVAINSAIRLKRNNARFYGLRAATAEELGDHELLEKSLKLQRKHGPRKDKALSPDG